jgi:DNA excision repair protein ERCC-4
MEVALPTTTAVPSSQRADVSQSVEPLLNPFTIIVDTAEQHPFTFAGIHADSDRKNRLLRFVPGVNVIRQCLGRHPHSLGDYSIEGFVGRVHVERKSMDDAHSTLLGWSGDGDVNRRERFECELRNLSNVECAAVVVECSFGQLVDQAPEYDQGKKTRACNAKILERSVIAYQQDYGVPWIFCDDRRSAEVVTFCFLNRFWQKHKPKRRSKSK